MLRVVHLGDERSAAGWRLAGADARVPSPGREAAALAEALNEARAADLVILSSTVAAALPEPLLREAAAALSPLLLVVPDPDGAAPVPDIALRLRTQLGLVA